MLPHVIGILGILACFALMFLGMPIGFAFGLVGAVGLCFLTTIGGGLASLPMISFDFVSNYTLTCLPMFILLGLIIAESGMAIDLFSMAYKWLGRVRGGLAVATIIACGFFGAVSGAATASAATMGSICYPEMKRYGYDPALATGAIAIGATMDVMIPPSNLMIIYCLLTDVSIGKLFFAGFVPGILEVIIFGVAIFFMTSRKPALAPVADAAFPMKEKIKSLLAMGPILLIILVVFGGMYSGIFTATEAGACGAAATILVTIGMRRLHRRTFANSVINTLRITAAVFMLIIGAVIFNSFIAATGLARALTVWVSNANLSPLMFIFLILLLYLPLGALMDEAAMVLLTIPIYLPTLKAFHIDLIWFGILIMLSCQIGLIAPPVGMVVFVVKAVVKDVSLGTIFRGCFPFILVAIGVLLLLVLVPELSLVFVSRMK